ncbi:MAG TPA: hypothetical protein VIY53_06310 [Acidobacteriaceae bacterium]
MLFAWMVNACALGFLLGAAWWMVRQRRRRARKPAKDLVISPMAGLAMGAMLLGFQAILQPQVRHVIAEEQEEKSVDDENGEEPPGGRLFHEQLRRIRHGEDVASVTVRLDEAAQKQEASG